MITQERVRELFDYDPSTGLLYSRVRRGSRRPPGPINGDGISRVYLQVWVDGQKHYVHRLIYLWMTGSTPAVIDHRDGNPRNNKWDNLRPCRQRENHMNCRGKRSKALPKGVRSGGKRSPNKFVSQIGVDGRTVHLGTFETVEEAGAAYQRAAVKYFGEFARLE